MMRSPVRALISPLCTTLFSYRVGLFVALFGRATASAARGPPPRDPATGSLRRVTARSPEWRARDAVWFLRMHDTVQHWSLLEQPHGRIARTTQPLRRPVARCSTRTDSKPAARH